MARTFEFGLLGVSALLLTGCYSDTTELAVDSDDAAVAVTDEDAAVVVSDAGAVSDAGEADEGCEAITDPIQAILCELTGGEPAAQGGLEDLLGGFLGRGRDAGGSDNFDFGGQPTEEECRDPADAITRFLCGRMTRRDAGAMAAEDAAVPPAQPAEPDAAVNEPSDAAVEVDAAQPFVDAGEHDAGLPPVEDAGTDAGVEDPALVLLDATVGP